MPKPKSQALATQDTKLSSGGGLIEFSTQSRDDPNDGVAFGDNPVHCACPHCDRSVITFIDYETSWVTWLLGLVVWFSLGWMAFWVLPLLWPAFKDAVHHCPRCLNVIARKSRISLPTFRTEVMTFKIGSCAVVLARKYVVIALSLVALIAAFYGLRSTMHLSPPEGLPRGEDSFLAWDDFLVDCGPRTGLRKHSMSSARAFEEKYRARTFTWQGEVAQIREGYDVLFLRTKSVVLMKMYPPRYTFRETADVALLFGEDRNAEVAELNPGDWVQFEATMTNHGVHGDPEVMLLWRIAKAERPKGPMLSSANRGVDPVKSKYTAEAVAEAAREVAASKAASKPLEQTPKPPPAEPVAPKQVSEEPAVKVPDGPKEQMANLNSSAAKEVPGGNHSKESPPSQDQQRSSPIETTIGAGTQA